MPDHEPAASSLVGADPEARQAVDEAFAEFYLRTVKHLTGFLVVQGASVADAAEIAQDTLGLAYTKWCTLRNPRAWSFRVASRALIRKLASVESPATLPEESTPLLRADAEHGALRNELVEAMSRLPPRQRQVMAWTLYEYTPAEIAEELGIESDAVRSSLRKARRAMAAFRDGTEDTDA